MELLCEFMRSLWKKHGQAISACLLILGLYVTMFALGITCPIRYACGISCPGCGMTRACVNAFRLDFSAAFGYHPMWILMPPLAIFVSLCLWRRWRRALRIGVTAVALVLCVVYVCRMVLSTGNVVVFEPQNGLIWRAIRAMIDGISG
ncbi:MAG: DUF2752 domain-containing protein [Clostridia bacterium]|nr:DUF2752 domain-containing protein [Clostridia bacterium]